MLSRNLKWTPAAEEIPIVAEVLARDLIDLDLDKPGDVMAALKELSREESEWPCTSMVIEKLRPTTHRTNAAMYKTEDPDIKRIGYSYNRPTHISKLVTDKIKELKRE